MKKSCAKSVHLADITNLQVGGIIFPSPLTGSVLEATAAGHHVESRRTAAGTLVTTVNRLHWNEGKGLRYWKNDDSPALPADQCFCIEGDWISWFTTKTA